MSNLSKPKKKSKRLLYLLMLLVIGLSIVGSRYFQFPTADAASEVRLFTIPTEGVTLTSLPSVTSTPDMIGLCGQNSIRFPTYTRDGRFGIEAGFVPQPGLTYFVDQPDLFFQLWTQDAVIEELESWDPFKARFDSFGSGKIIWDASLGWGNAIRNAAKGDAEKFDIYFQNFGAAYYLQLTQWLRAYVTNPTTPASSCLRFPEAAPAISAEERAELQRGQGPNLPGNGNSASIPNTGLTAPATPFGTLPPPTMVVGPENNPFNLELAKIKSACETTPNQGACENETLKMRTMGYDLATSLTEGVADGNSTCTLTIDALGYYELPQRSDIWNLTRALHVIRIDNNDPSRLRGVGAVGSGGVQSVCIDEITGAPTTVGGGTWQNASNNILGPTANFYPWFKSDVQTTSGLSSSMLGGVISISALYPSDTITWGSYGVAQEYTNDGQSWAVYEVCENGLCVSPVINLANGNPTVTPVPSVTPLPPPIQAIIAVTSTVGPPPTPAALRIENLKSYASNLGHTMFFLTATCSGGSIPEPRSSVIFTNNLFSAQIDLTSVSIGCSYQEGRYAVITTDHMSGSGWAQIGDVWISP